MSEPEPEIQPEIAVVFASEGHWRDAALHLLHPLGLPQVAIYAAGDRLPASVSAVLLFGPNGWRPPIEPSVKAVWRLADGRQRGDGRDPTVRTPFGQAIELPASQTLRYAPASLQDGHDPALSAAIALFWCHERLVKRPGDAPAGELLAWLVTLAVMLRLGGSVAAAVPMLLASVEDKGARRHLGEATLAGRKNRAGSLQSRILRTIFLLNNAGQSRGAENHCPLWPRSREFLRNPAAISACVLLDPRGERAKVDFSEAVRPLLCKATNAYHLVALEVAARLGGRRDEADQIAAKLSSIEYASEFSFLPRSAPKSTGFCYSPLLAACFLLRPADRGKKVGDASFSIHLTKRRALSWSFFKSASRDWSVDRPAGFALIDEKTRRVSRRLLDNWLLLHSAPCEPRHRFVLRPAQYRSAIRSLEHLWLAFFRWLLHREKRPLLRLCPWPAPYKSAFSLRYDVDRKTTLSSVRRIIEIQRKELRAPCATWYYFKNDKQRNLHRKTLKDGLQRRGLHVERPADAQAGAGVTHHSAATSAYWQGDLTSETLDAAGAAYGEFLSERCATPRPVWIMSDAGGRVGNLWIVPTHFPLEGSTSDETLEYFDLLCGEFRDAVQNGEHVIVASHPDLNQELLLELCRRENIRALWRAPVETVIERCRTVLEPGAVRYLGYEGGKVKLQAPRGVSDLALDVYRPCENEPTRAVVNLLPEIPLWLTI